jgi:peptidoglycan/xylan/chitin deacetylase (PgdA/CDA1 family)
MKKEPFVIFGFDMETDIGSWTREYRGLKKGTPIILDILDKGKVRATFFFTADAAKNNPEIVQQIRGRGHEIGNHSLYHETVGEALFYMPYDSNPLLAEEVKPRLEKATEILAKIAGERPVSFRAPRLFGGVQVIRVLQEIGFLVDASYPTYYYGQPFEPYHPSRENWTIPGDSKILEIPIFSDLSLPTKDPYKRDRDQWPKLRLEGAAALKHSVDSFAEFCHREGKVITLCFYLHPWEFVNMPKTIDSPEARIELKEVLWKNCGDRTAKELEDFLSLLKNDGAKFFTAQNFFKFWESNYCPLHKKGKHLLIK